MISFLVSCSRCSVSSCGLFDVCLYKTKICGFPVLKNVPCPPPTHHMALLSLHVPRIKHRPELVGITRCHHWLASLLATTFLFPHLTSCDARQRGGKNFPKEVFYDPLPNKYPHILLVDPPARFSWYPSLLPSLPCGL